MKLTLCLAIFLCSKAVGIPSTSSIGKPFADIGGCIVEPRLKVGMAWSRDCREKTDGVLNGSNNVLTRSIMLMRVVLLARMSPLVVICTFTDEHLQT